MTQKIQLEGENAQVFIQFLSEHSIVYEKQVDEFHTWLEGTVLVITVAASLLTIVDILKKWLESKREIDKPINLIIKIDGSVFDLNGEYEDTVRILDDFVENSNGPEME